MAKDSSIKLDYFTPTVVITSDDGNSFRSYQAAGPGARLLAGLFDFVLQVLCFMAMAVTANSTYPELFPPQSWIWTIPLGFIEWHIIYCMLFESFSGGVTPGKALLKIRVTGKNGTRPTITGLIVRNIGRVIDLLTLYIGSFIMIALTPNRQRIGDFLGNTTVIYKIPLSTQMAKSDVPESIYSTSEDGYLLEAWIRREGRMDPESRMASALDLAAYLHNKYGEKTNDLPDPAVYLRDLYTREQQHSDHEQQDSNDEI